MEKLPLPSTATTGSLICQAWAEEVPAGDLSHSPRSALSPSGGAEGTLGGRFVNTQALSCSFLSRRRASLSSPFVCAPVRGVSQSCLTHTSNHLLGLQVFQGSAALRSQRLLN